MQEQEVAECASPVLSGLLYFLAGGLTGAALAVLVAPQSGAETRQALRRRLGAAAGAACDAKERLVRRGEKLRHEAGQRVDDAVSALAGGPGVRLPE